MSALRMLISACLLFLIGVTGNSWAEEDELLAEATKSIQLPDTKQVEVRIAELEAIAEPTQEAKTSLELFRSALSRLNAAKEDEQTAARFRAAIDGAVKQRSLIEQRLKRVQSRAATKIPPSTRNASLTVLSQQLDASKANRQEAERRLSELQAQLVAERLRVEQSGQELAEAKRQLDEAGLDAKKQEQVVTGVLAEAHRSYALALRLSLINKIDRLKLERLSNGPRVELLRVSIGLAKLELNRFAELEQQLSELIGSRRTAEADKALQATTKAQAKASGKHLLIEESANENAQLGSELADVIRKSQQSQKQGQRIGYQVRLIQQRLARLSRQLEFEGLDSGLGDVLRSRRAELVESVKLLDGAERTHSDLTEVRLAQFRVTDEQIRLQPNGELTQYLEGLRPADMQADAWSALQRDLRRLFDDRLRLLGQLLEAYGQSEKQLADLSLSYQELETQVELYGDLLFQNLLWIPSTNTLSWGTLQQIQQGLSKAYSWQEWSDGLRGIYRQMLAHPWKVALGTLLIAVLLSVRGRVMRSLARMVGKVGNVSHDRFFLTFKALGLTLILALPWVLIVALFGTELIKSDQHNFGEAVLVGFRRILVVFLVFQALRYLLMPNGLAEIHFRWKPSVIQLFQRHLRWFVPLWMPMVFIVGVTEWLPADDMHNSFGRIAFLAGVIILACFLHATLNPWQGVPKTVADGPVSLMSRLAAPYIAAMAISVGFFTLASSGYFYTALRFERLLLLSLLSVVFGFLVYSLALRWLLVAERRLALARARAKRLAAVEARAAKEAAEAAGEGLPDQLDMESVNLATINEQTRRLLRLFSLLVTAVLLALIWWDLTPAFSWLNEVVLWQYAAQGSSGELLAQVGLTDVLVAIIAVVLTIVAGRNLPGLLEITLLQAMDLDPGTRYAASNFSRYVIYTAGSLLVLQLIGLGWDDVQWLIAAMGVGLGFGLKEIFANLISGIMILFERPIRIGDTVTIGDISGTVTRIRMRATTITDWDNKELVVPNKSFIVDPLINWTLSDQITRVVIKLGIAYGSDTERAHAVMSEVVNSHPEVMHEPNPTVFFIGFGESSLDFEIRIFVKERLLRMPLTHDLHMGLEKALTKAGIEIPFPQRDLHIRSADGFPKPSPGV